MGFFAYNKQKDHQNFIDGSSSYQVQRFKISGDKRILEILGESQPSSIFDKLSSELICYPGNVSLLKRSICLPNVYEQFWAPWLADGSYSYPSEGIRDDWKRWFPTGHLCNLEANSGKTVNYIDDSLFNGLKCIINGKLKVIIKNHSDADNYWHWTFEWVPRLIQIKNFIGIRKCRNDVQFIVLGKDLNQFQKDWMTVLFGFVPEYTRLSSPIICDQLASATLELTTHHNPGILDELRNLIVRQIPYLDIPRDKYSKIYISRGAARNGRLVSSEPRIIEMLKLKGYKVVTMDGLSVFRQAYLFMNADIIIGPHGSAFVNMLFCRPKTRVIEMFGPGYLSGHDYSLAYQNSLDWIFVEGTSADAKSNFYSNYVVNPGQLIPFI